MAKTQQSTKRGHKLAANRLLVAGLLVLGLTLLLAVVPNNSGYFTAKVAASSACPSSTPTGSSRLTVNVDTTADYNVWSRLKIPTSNDSFYLKIDSTCYKVVGSNLPNNQWGWVNFENGTTGAVIKRNLTVGSHAISVIGNEDGVQVDRLILTTGSCVPSGTGDACALSVDSAPTVSLDAPTNGANITGVARVTATAVDDTAVSKVNFYVDSSTTPFKSITAAPYNFDWDVSSIDNGNHTLTAKAIDNLGQSDTASAAVNIQVQPPPPTTGQVYIATPVTNDTVMGKDAAISAGVNVSNVSKVDYVLDDTKNLGAAAPTVYGWIIRWDTTLVPNGSHKIVARATAGGTTYNSDPVTVTVNNTSANGAPTIPGNLRLARPPYKYSATIKWDASSDDSGGTIRYYLYLNGVFKGKQQGLNRQFGNLTKGTTYTAKVVAVDEAGNQSKPATLTFRTKSYCITKGVCVW